jgi:hypothetical protein
MPSAPQLSSLDPFGDIKVASGDSKMTLRGFRETLQLTDGEPPGPGPSGGHENHQGLAAARLTFDFQR